MMKSILAFLCLFFISSIITFAQTLKVEPLGKNGHFKTRISIPSNDRHINELVDLQSFNKLVIRKIDLINEDGNIYSCGEDFVGRAYDYSSDSGWIIKEDFRFYILEMIQSIGGFEEIMEDSLINIYGKVNDDILIMDLRLYWKGCSYYQFEMFVSFSSGRDSHVLFSMDWVEIIRRNSGQRLVHPVLNAYIDWLNKGKSGSTFLRPPSDFINTAIAQIGSQAWMQRNLNVATFRNGDLIKEAKSVEEWELALENEEPAWCYLHFNPINGLHFGKLYNYYAVSDARKLAPEGWRIPNIEDWHELTQYDFSTELLHAKIELLMRQNDTEEMAKVGLEYLSKFDEVMQNMQQSHDASVARIKKEIDELEKQKGGNKVILKKYEEISALNHEHLRRMENWQMINNPQSFTTMEQLMQEHFSTLEINKQKWKHALIAGQYWPESMLIAAKPNGFNALPAGRLGKENYVDFRFEEILGLNDIFPVSADWWFSDNKGNIIGHFNLSPFGLADGAGIQYYNLLNIVKETPGMESELNDALGKILINGASVRCIAD